MMERLVARIVDIDQATPFLDRAVLGAGVLSLSVAMMGTFGLYL